MTPVSRNTLLQSPHGVFVQSPHGVLDTTSVAAAPRIVILWSGFHAIRPEDIRIGYISLKHIPGPPTTAIHDPEFDASTGRPNWDRDNTALRATLASAEGAIRLGVLHHIIKPDLVPTGLTRKWLLPIDVAFPLDIIEYRIGKIAEFGDVIDPGEIPTEEYIRFIEALAPDGLDIAILIYQYKATPVSVPLFKAAVDALRLQYPQADIREFFDHPWAEGQNLSGAYWRQWLIAMKNAVSLVPSLP